MNKVFVLLGFTGALLSQSYVVKGAQNAMAPKEYRGHCGMIFTAAEAKKDNYICPMDHLKMISALLAAVKHPLHSVSFLAANPQDSLFFNPGGAYTSADIAANGDTTPERKYSGIIPHHNTAPVKGDYLCPITHTKASPRFSWIVGGRKYLFCCPPCIDEFVKHAKAHPESLRPPAFYRKA